MTRGAGADGVHIGKANSVLEVDWSDPIANVSLAWGYRFDGAKTGEDMIIELAGLVAVTSCGFCSFSRYMEGDLTGWSHRGYMPRIADLYGADPARMPFDFTEVLAAIAPRAVFVNAPLGDSNFEVRGVYDCLNAAAPVYSLLGASKRLVAVHPDCGHDFPPAVREQAYEFMARELG